MQDEIALFLLQAQLELLGDLKQDADEMLV